MVQGMLFSEIKAAAAGARLVGQLLSLKRCFGGRVEVGVVVSPGKVDRCGTVAELVVCGHAPGGLEWIDRFLPAIPTVYKLPADDFMVVPPRYPDGPPCPWDVARREQEAARVRVAERRAARRMNEGLR